MMNYIFKCRAFFKMNDLHSSTSNGHLKNAVLLCAVFFSNEETRSSGR